MKISKNVNFKMLWRGKFWVVLSAVFGNDRETYPEAYCTIKWKIFFRLIYFFSTLLRSRCSKVGEKRKRGINFPQLKRKGNFQVKVYLILTVSNKARKI